MKKILVLFLSLMLLMPVTVLGEVASGLDTYPVNLGDFSITVTSADIIQKGEKAEGVLLFQLFPAYDENSMFHSNINGTWTAEDLSIIGEIGAETYGNVVLEQTSQQLASQGIAVSNTQLLYAEFDEETQSTSLIVSMDVDYTAVGVDLVMTLYQVQMYIPFGDGSSYIFTISSDTLENTETMMSYLETMEFSSDPINNTDTSFVESSSNVVDTSSVTIGQKNALRKAIDYLDYTAFSRSGLIDQLKFEGFTDSEATYGVDHCGADWNEQAILKARDYLDYTSFSRQGLIDQLEFEGFSNAQAVYGVDSCNVDWNEQAAKKAQDYLDYTSFSRQGLIDQLLYEGFSNEQALYGVTAVGY